MMRKRSGIVKIMSKRSFLIVNLGLVLLVGWGFAGEFVRNRNVQEEIEKLEQQTDNLIVRNQGLAEQMERYSGSAILEREARLKLNLKKPGESVVIVHEMDRGAATVSVESGGEVSVTNTIPGTQDELESFLIKWFNYFFPTTLEN